MISENFRKHDDFLNFTISHERPIEKIYKNLVDSNSISEEIQRHVGNIPGLMHGSCKLHEKCIDDCPPLH